MFRSGATAEPDERRKRRLVERDRGGRSNVLNSFREREGAAIAAEMRQRCADIWTWSTRMEEIRPGPLPPFRNACRERLRDLLRGAGIGPAAPGAGGRHAGRPQRYQRGTDPPQDPRRPAGDMLTGGGEIGKRLDFLLQEMNRETNTVLSKTGGLGDLGLTITDLALAAKAEIDKIREQSLTWN